MIKLHQTGDTIVEVLIAIAIVGTVLAGAFASSNRSLQSNSRSQERAEALRVAEQQLELLQSAVADNPVVLTGREDFCVANDRVLHNLDGIPPPNFQNDNYTGTYKGECNVSYSSDTFFYYPWIELADEDTDTYIVRVRWDGAGGFKQETSLSYRLHL